MLRPRIIPVLLLKDGALVKTLRFGRPRYVGDPINAVRIFNELHADELVFLDISAGRAGGTISPELVRRIGEEANMPFAVGGGIRDLAQIREILAAGAEKVVLCSAAAERPDFVREASEAFAASSIAVCIDVKRHWLQGRRAWTAGGTRKTPYDPLELARLVERNGAGEIIVQSIERDGTMTGYDLETIRDVATAVAVPVVALGGAGTLADMERAYRESYASAMAAGSLFVFHGPHQGVLIHYPGRAERPC